MKKKDFEKFLNKLIKKFNPFIGDVVKKDTGSVEDKFIYIETCIEYILFENEVLKRELKAKD